MVIETRLQVSGLARLAGPFSFVLALVAGGNAQAQDYVDLEAERAATNASETTQPRDPYSAGPATSYPATSYGVSSTLAPIVGAAQTAPAVSQGQNQNLGNLFYQLQELQQEVRMLNGKVEEQAHELRQLKKQSLDRYVDIDRRLASDGAARVAPLANVPAAGVVPTVTSPAGSATEQVGESDVYRSAYALVRGQKFSEATAAFKQFLQDFPAGKYAPNAHYWLGELYLVTEPPDLESSRQAFALLLSQYPTNSKAPDATYKLGKVHFMKGNREKAREYFDRVISQYGGTNSSAVQLSRDFIAENY
jgi:tol-pal system protein YbgF